MNIKQIDLQAVINYLSKSVPKTNKLFIYIHVCDFGLQEDPGVCRSSKSLHSRLWYQPLFVQWVYHVFCVSWTEDGISGRPIEQLYTYPWLPLPHNPHHSQKVSTIPQSNLTKK